MVNDIATRSARLRRSVTILFAVCLALVLGERFSAVTIRVFATGDWRPLACQAASAVPELLYLVGLWWVRDALDAFSRGELFAPPIARMLDRVGVMLACGSAVRILLVPAACRLLGFNPGYWIAFDAAALVLAALGLALKAIAAVLRHASTIQSELDGIF
jgi:hypothetical protein